MDEDVKVLLEAMRQENAAAHAETRQHVDATAAETRHRVEMAAENQREAIQQVAEGIAMLAERMDRRDAQFEQVTTDLDRRVTRLEVESSSRR
ncbi:MAG TPA: hypothetical protein VEK79_15480 [Thermoanaerobaculia bacterium]|nr:hypothetical protein [Thermoanaerobaculia bacterium]